MKIFSELTLVLKNPLLLISIFILCAMSCEQKVKGDDAVVKGSTQEYYQLKIYQSTSENQIATIDAFLKEAFLPGLKRLGIQDIGVFKPRSILQDSVKEIYVLIPFNTLNDFLVLDDLLQKDSVYHRAGETYLNASYDNPPYHRIESILLKAFRDFPIVQPTPLEGPRENRIYELRSYESPTEAYYHNKVDMFNAGGEIKLFDRLGFNAVFYADVISGAQMPNLMYMTTFSDSVSRETHWKAFVEAPEWKDLIADPKYANNVSHADIHLLTPTEYSDY